MNECELCRLDTQGPDHDGVRAGIIIARLVSALDPFRQVIIAGSTIDQACINCGKYVVLAPSSLANLESGLAIAVTCDNCVAVHVNEHGGQVLIQDPRSPIPGNGPTQGDQPWQ